MWISSKKFEEIQKRPEIVRFKDGRYGVRRRRGEYSAGYPYEYLDMTKGDDWWISGAIRDCCKVEDFAGIEKALKKAKEHEDDHGEPLAYV